MLLVLAGATRMLYGDGGNEATVGDDEEEDEVMTVATEARG